MGRWSSSESEDEDKEKDKRERKRKSENRSKAKGEATFRYKGKVIGSGDGGEDVQEIVNDTTGTSFLRPAKKMKDDNVSSELDLSIEAKKNADDDMTKNEETKERNVFETARCRSVYAYEMVGRSGEGTYGVVYKAKDKELNRDVALKQVKMKKELCREGFPITTLRETNILLALQHPNIVGVREMVVEDIDDKEQKKQEEDDFGPFRVYMVMDYWQHELKALMQSKPEPFTQSEVKCMMKQLLEALSFMHSKWFVHRDLKTANILYNNDGSVAICDFGLARKYDEPPQGKMTELVITLHYRPPELLLGAESYSAEVDVWSMGCIFAELLQNKVLFYGRGELEQLDKIFALLGTPCEENWPGVSKLKLFSKFGYLGKNTAKSSKLKDLFPRSTVTGGPYLSATGTDLLSKMLEMDPSKRISAEEALNHPWFAEVPLPKPKSEMPKFYSTYKSNDNPDPNEKGAHDGGLFAQANRHRM